MKRNKRGQFIGGEGYWKGKKNPHTEEHKLKVSRALKGRMPKNIKELHKSLVGRKVVHSIEARRKISEKLKGSKSHLWRGGITPINNQIRTSLEYKLWRESVFKRDNYTCIFCNKKGGKLNADHIKPFAYFPELRLAIDNGRTLCIECHRLTDTYANRYYGKRK